MSQKLQFKVRLDEDLHNKIKTYSERSSRSVNAEIVHRLELSFIHDSPESEVLSAEQARKIAEQSLIDGYQILLTKCFNQILNEAKKGLKESFIDTGYEEWDDDVEDEVITPVITKLQQLGYDAKIEDGGIYIKF